LADESFDVITMVDTIYYLHQPLRDLRRLRGLLKPGGLVFGGVPELCQSGMGISLDRASF
jgi:2-polyprenyl-3-methyl-5-hydroxy-6-metoxy-1,4-benzoquinol methylase